MLTFLEVNCKKNKKLKCCKMKNDKMSKLLCPGQLLHMSSLHSASFFVFIVTFIDTHQKNEREKLYMII